MNEQRITPLDKLREEKQKLKISCKRQEAKLLNTLDYVEDNIVPLALGATAHALMNPAQLITAIRPATSQKKAKEESNSGPVSFLAKSALGFVSKTALGFIIKKKFGNKSTIGKILGLALPFLTPVASSTLVKAQPFFVNLVKTGANNLLNWKKNRAKKK